MKLRLLVIFLVPFLFFPISLAIPNGIPVQGILTDLNENPETGDFQFTFSLVNQSGNEVWTETKTITTDSNGYFSTQINPTGIDFSKDYNLSIKVGSDNLGQIPLLSSFYSLNSQRLQGHESNYFLDTSSTPQTKEGNLTVNSYIIAQSGLCIGADCITNGPIGDITSITAGSGLTGGGTSGDITISHADTSSQSSVNNNGGTVVQDISLDNFGHVTGINSVNLDNRYIQGSGNSGYIPKFTGTKSIGNSVIHQSSGNVIIGTTTSNANLNVHGNLTAGRLNKFKFRHGEWSSGTYWTAIAEAKYDNIGEIKVYGWAGSGYTDTFGTLHYYASGSVFFGIYNVVNEDGSVNSYSIHKTSVGDIPDIGICSLTWDGSNIKLKNTYKSLWCTWTSSYTSD